MMIYRFKMITDDNDKFYREIEIKPNNTFEDFHKIILECTNLEEGEMASFYICDSKWNKIQEITLADVSDPDISEEEQKKVFVMSDVKLKESINDPHQRLIYIYDFFKMNTFFIELTKITEGDEKVKYPRCSRSVSELQKNVRQMPPPEDFEDLDESLEEDSDLYNIDDLDFDEGNTIFGDSIDERSYN